MLLYDRQPLACISMHDHTWSIERRQFSPSHSNTHSLNNVPCSRTAAVVLLLLISRRGSGGTNCRTDCLKINANDVYSFFYSFFQFLFTAHLACLLVCMQAKQGADAVVNAGKGIVEMGGSLISGLKRGFSKTSETGGE